MRDNEHPRFTHAEKGMMRFPPNVEQITVEVESSGTVTLRARRNDLILEFTLEPADCEHLAAMLLKDIGKRSWRTKVAA
jgi:hypothetical protein